MENKEFLEDMKDEINNLNRIAGEMKELLSKVSDNPNFIEIRGSASILHDFYSGVEKIFKRIALSIDNNLATGEDWHKELLLQMARPFGQRKKVIINERLLGKLKEYLRFRHLFRHIYGFELKWDIIKPLCLDMENVLNELKNELDKFFSGLKE